MGWSQGGGTVLNTLRTDSSARPGGLPPSRDFQAAVAFYPGSCSAARQPGGWSSRIPLLVLLGEKDVWSPLQPCEALLTEAASAGNPVTLRIYSGAYHDFDCPGSPIASGRNSAPRPASCPSPAPTLPPARMPSRACPPSSAVSHGRRPLRA